MIELEFDGKIALVTVDVPATRNALNVELAHQLVGACDEINKNTAVGAAVIRGAGSDFCSGAERALLDDVGSDPIELDRYEWLGDIYRAFTRFGQLEVPTIAAVRGAAVGAGFNLMLAADLRIVAKDARLISGFLAIGLHPGGGHFSLLADRAGTEAAAAIAIFSEEISGTRAAELGLAWMAVSSEQVDERATTLAHRAAQDPTLARMMRASLRAELGPPPLPWSAAVEVERAPQLWSLRRRADKRASALIDNRRA